MTVQKDDHVYRKWLGVVCFFLEMNLLGGTIFGFPGIFPILSKNGIYENRCAANTTSCDAQTTEYQNAMTVGIALFEIPLFFVGILIDRFGCRFVKLIGIVFHIIGWLSLALVRPGYDSLIYVHCAFSSMSGSFILITSFASSNYFSKSRAFVSALFTGAVISATMWFSVFQNVIDKGRCELSTLSYIWLAFGVLMLISSFAFLDWNFAFWNLPYKFDTELEVKDESNGETVWQHLKNPLYILVILFLSILLLPSVFLSVIWQPWIKYITEQDTAAVDKYTFAYTLSTISAIGICPLNGYLLGFRAERSQKQKLLNISLVETISWVFNVVLCIMVMFPSSSMIVPVIVINCFARSTIIGGCQAVVCTFFPSKYVGRLTGIMWTTAGVIVFINFGLVKLTGDISKAWKAWVIILALAVLMSCHLIQIFLKYWQERRKPTTNPEDTEVQA